MLVGFNKGAGFGAPPIDLVYRSHNTVEEAHVTVPNDVVFGDFMLAFENAEGTSGQQTPTGWTSLLFNATGGEAHVIAKVSDGTEGGDTLAITGDATPLSSMCIVFDGGVDSFTQVDADIERGSGDMTAQTKNISTIGTLPALVYGIYMSGGIIDPRTFTGETPDGEQGLNSANGCWIKWFFAAAGTSPSDITVDMDDEGQENVLASSILEMT